MAAEQRFSSALLFCAAGRACVFWTITRSGRGVSPLEMMGNWDMYPAGVWSVGAPVRTAALVRAVPTMDDILVSLHRAFDDLTLQCAVASLGHFIPQMRCLEGFEALHRENYEVSYHLATAIGAARHITAGSREPGYFALVVACQREAHEHQRKATAAYRRMAAAAPPSLLPLMQRLGGHIQATAGHVQRSIGLSVASLGPEQIAQLVRWTESAERD